VLVPSEVEKSQAYIEHLEARIAELESQIMDMAVNLATDRGRILELEDVIEEMEDLRDPGASA